MREPFTEVQHVGSLGLDRATDSCIWDYARNHNLCIVTKDADFSDLSARRGAPPKVIWLRIGNCLTSGVAWLLHRHAEAISQFLADPNSDVLILVR